MKERVTEPFGMSRRPTGEFKHGTLRGKVDREALSSGTASECVCSRQSNGVRGRSSEGMLRILQRGSAAVAKVPGPRGGGIGGGICKIHGALAGLAGGRDLEGSRWGAA